MLPSIIDLKADKNLLNSNFDGYKLSLDSIPQIKQNLTSKPDQNIKSESQYTLLHTQLFALQNHLVKDNWLPGTSYFIDKNWTIQKIQYEETDGRLKPLCSVFKLQRSRQYEAGDYNVTFQFISEKYCVLSDGIGSLKIIDTGDRSRSSEWKIVYSGKPLTENVSFVIQDARFEVKSCERQFHCILLHVDGKESILDWIYVTLNTETNQWSEEGHRKITGKSSINYCALEPKCNSLIISSDRNFKFIFDSENPIIEEIVEKSELNSDEVKYPFSWSQTDDDLTINFDKRVDAENHDYKVTCTEKTVRVLCKEEILMNCEVFGKIDPDLTTWNLQNQFLQMTLVKGTPTLNWYYFTLEGPTETLDTQGENQCTPSSVSTFVTEMEDCDFGINGSENEFFIERLNAITHKVTHKIFLGTIPPLFNVTLRPNFPQAIVLRQDVDALVWLPQISPIDSENWNFRHEGTLDAFGYVQASKLQKKFMHCSPDMNYSIICELDRHVFIYKGRHDTSDGLRNRSSSQKVCIGQQQLVVLDNTGQVLGISVENNFTILLTEEFVICLQINV